MFEAMTAGEQQERLTEAGLNTEVEVTVYVPDAPEDERERISICRVTRLCSRTGAGVLTPIAEGGRPLNIPHPGGTFHVIRIEVAHAAADGFLNTTRIRPSLCFFTPSTWAKPATTDEIAWKEQWRRKVSEMGLPVGDIVRASPQATSLAARLDDLFDILGGDNDCGAILGAKLHRMACQAIDDAVRFYCLEHSKDYSAYKNHEDYARGGRKAAFKHAQTVTYVKPK